MRPIVEDDPAGNHPGRDPAWTPNRIGTQHGDQFVEPSLVDRRELEPRQEVDRLAEVPAVVQAARHGREVLQAGRDKLSPARSLENATSGKAQG